MAFKLIVFIGILIAIAVFGSRAYSAAVARFEARQPCVGDGSDDLRN